MKLRLVLALLSLAVACGAIAMRASSQAKANAAPAAVGNETCSDCDGPDPAAVLPNPYKADAAATPAAPIAQTTPAAPAKN